MLTGLQFYFTSFLHSFCNGVTSTNLRHDSNKDNSVELLLTSLNITTGHWTMPVKNRVMSDEGCFTKDTVVRRKVKKVL